MTYFTKIFPLLLLAWNIPVLATQHALVVGINQYKHTNELKKLTNLKGAVNDAKLLRDALREAQVQLPERRVLLDANATRSAFLRAWRDMLASVGWVEERRTSYFFLVPKHCFNAIDLRTM